MQRLEGRVIVAQPDLQKVLLHNELIDPSVTGFATPSLTFCASEHKDPDRQQNKLLRNNLIAFAD